MLREAVLLICLATCHGQLVTFDLSDYNTENVTTHLHKVFVNITSGEYAIEVNNVGDNIGFFVIQVHSYANNVSLSSSGKFKRKNTVTGTNVGLISFTKDEAIFYLQNQNATRALIVLIVYDTKDPIPGGCNLTFDTEYAPYQVVSNTDDLIIVESQAPSAFDTTCDNNVIRVELYHLFLHENNYDSSYYFNGIQNMLTVDSIKSKGYKVKTVGGYYTFKKLYSSYKGVGQVFAIVATYRNRSSAYVPAVSYGCDLCNLESCNAPETPHWKWICAFLLIFGGFISLFGHKFFRTTLFLSSFTLGIFLTYVIVSVSGDSLTVAEKTTTAALIGLLYGPMWLAIWWKFGIPILSVSITFILGEFLLSSIIFYAGVADFGIFRNDGNFWLTFVVVMLAIHTIWTMWTLESHMFACSFVGAYAFIAALNYYTGGNLQYIVINSFRRMVVPEFNMATIEPPFQILDIAHCILWILLTNFGFYYQMKEQRGKPPFPPHRYRAAVLVGVNEITPLLGTGGVVYSEI